MNEQDKLKANIAGSKVLDGLQGIEDGIGVWYPLHNRHFDIFTNKADLMDVVVVLGEKYDVRIMAENVNGSSTRIWRASVWKGFVAGYGTYQEAVAAALLELDKE